MDQLLSRIQSPEDLRRLAPKELERLAGEMREALCRLVSTRTAHFASNLGVVELTLALHTTFDFLHDRLIWDTGHQIYPHKLVTGRYDEFTTLRAKGGLMGYPNPIESEYDLLMTGHAGCSVSTGLGVQCADDLLRPDEDRHTVAVVGDGALPCGVIFEAMNHTGGLKKNLTVVLNDNKMSICPRVGSLADSLDRLRLAPFYTGLKAEVQRVLAHLPVVGDPVEKMLSQLKDAVKAGLLGGMIFEELGFRYIGPLDGHNIPLLRKYLLRAKQLASPVLLHVVTEKGHGYEPAARDPRTFHTPPPFTEVDGSIVTRRSEAAPPYTQIARDTMLDMMHQDERIVVITAAMCQGTMLEPIRDAFPQRFFDVGICEEHAVAMAAGMAKAGLRPVVDIYSTFLQRGYDQIFQELSLQGLPVTLLLDRAGIVGPDGPTHHGVFDLCYLRPFPHLAVAAPGDAEDLAAMLRWSVGRDHPVAIRHPKTSIEELQRRHVEGDGRVRSEPIALGRAEVLREGDDGLLLALGTTVIDCAKAADRLLDESDVRIGVINARFAKPLDVDTILPAIERAPWTITVEEGQLAGGFGSAVLEACCEQGIDTRRLRRLGIGDYYVEHGTRKELLADLGLDTAGIVAACHAAAEAHSVET